jgi:Fur family ferric uptake transcriptional regulator
MLQRANIMIRSTLQRKAIMEAIAGEARPLTVPEIHASALRLAPRIGLRTVYRNVRELVQDGKLVCVAFPGQPPRYENVGVRGDRRPHIVCSLCNKVFELGPECEPKVEHPDIPGFVVEGTETVYFGRCKDPEHCPHRSARQS